MTSSKNTRGTAAKKIKTTRGGTRDGKVATKKPAVKGSIGDEVIAPEKRGRKPAATVKKTAEIKKDVKEVVDNVVEGVSVVVSENKDAVKDVANDVSEKFKDELEDIVAKNVEIAPKGSDWNKIFRNGIIVALVVLAGVVAWSLLF